MAIIELHDVKKDYYLGNTVVHAVNGVSFSINEGDFLSIVAPSGSGKTTLLNMIGCIDIPTEGKIVVDGEDITKMNDKQLTNIRNKEIGFIFQTFNLLPRATALDNVILPMIYAGKNKKEREMRGREVLEQVQLADRMEHRPNELSGGQRQRVAVARALVNKPSIILADEPTGNLDSKTSVEIMTLFNDIHRNGNTVIVVTHEEDIALHAHRIIRLRDGLIESDEINRNIIKPEN